MAAAAEDIEENREHIDEIVSHLASQPWNQFLASIRALHDCVRKTEIWEAGGIQSWAATFRCAVQVVNIGLQTSTHINCLTVSMFCVASFAFQTIRYAGLG